MYHYIGACQGMPPDAPHPVGMADFLGRIVPARRALTWRGPSAEPPVSLERLWQDGLHDRRHVELRAQWAGPPR